MPDTFRPQAETDAVLFIQQGGVTYGLRISVVSTELSWNEYAPATIRLEGIVLDNVLYHGNPEDYMPEKQNEIETGKVLEQ